jgi:hypothetical protein
MHAGRATRGARRWREPRICHPSAFAACAIWAGRLGPALASHPLDPSPKPGGATTWEHREGTGTHEVTEEPLAAESDSATWIAMVG